MFNKFIIYISFTWFVISSCSSGVSVANWSYFVPIKNGIAVFYILIINVLA